MRGDSCSVPATVCSPSPTPSTDRKLSTSELYLCDSGAQYRDGTTDVTRTVHFGTPTEKEKVSSVMCGVWCVMCQVSKVGWGGWSLLCGSSGDLGVL